MSRMMRIEYERWLAGFEFTQYLVLTFNNEALDKHSLSNDASVRKLVKSTMNHSGHRGQWLATFERHASRNVYHVNLLTEPSPYLDDFVRLWKAEYGWVKWIREADAGAVRYALKEIISDDDLAGHLDFELRRPSDPRPRRRGGRGRGGRLRAHS